MRTSHLTALAFGLSVAVSALPAQALEGFECSFKLKPANRGWLPELVVVAWDGDKANAAVYDPIINQFIGEPIPARLDTDNDKRTTFSWEVKAKSGVNQNVRMQYRLTIMKADLRGSVAATAPGYEGNFQATGTCKTAKE